MEMIITIPSFLFINPNFIKTNDYPIKNFVSFKNYYINLTTNYINPQARRTKSSSNREKWQAQYSILNSVCFNGGFRTMSRNICFFSNNCALMSLLSTMKISAVLIIIKEQQCHFISLQFIIWSFKSKQLYNQK